ncbi:MAG: RNA polymerase subunit sigma-54, partial [Exiguobacterium indicum]
MDQRQEQTQQMTLSASQQYQLHVLEQPAAELEEEWRRLKRRLHRHYPNQVSLEVEQMAGHLASYEDELLAQIRLESVRQEIGYMAEQLIVYLEADGLLRTSDEQLAASFSTDVATITEARTLLQQCEPVGIAARSE